MKTYTFADRDAPVRDHMAGLVKALRLLAERQDRESYAEKRAGARAFGTAKAIAYREIADMIEDSHSSE